MKYLEVEGARRPEAERRRRRAGQHVEVTREVREEGISNPIYAIPISDLIGDD